MNIENTSNTPDAPRFKVGDTVRYQLTVKTREHTSVKIRTAVVAGASATFMGCYYTLHIRGFPAIYNVSEYAIEIDENLRFKIGDKVLWKDGNGSRVGIIVDYVYFFSNYVIVDLDGDSTYGVPDFSLSLVS